MQHTTPMNLRNIEGSRVRRAVAEVNRVIRMFESNQKSLFEELEGIERVNDTTPDAEESWAFWNRI